MPLPPPYTPNADDPLPIIYQLAASQSAPDIHGNFGRGSANPAIAGVHLGQSRNSAESDRRRSRSQDQNPVREGRRMRGRHRRRRSRGIASQNPGNEDQSALIYAAQDTAINSSLEDDSTLADDNTQPDMNTQSCTDILGDAVTAATTVTNAVNSEDNMICDNTLADNVMFGTGDRGEFIELGDTLTIPSGVDPDRLTLQSETSGSFYSGADSASGCSTLEQGSSNSLNKGKTHRRSVSGVSCISKTSVEPSVSKVDEEPCECKCTCKCDCKPGVNCGDKCSECDKSMHEENDSVTKSYCDNKTAGSIDDLHGINDNEQRSLDREDNMRRNTTTSVSHFTLETNGNTASFV